jgi:predicted metal-dependent hydrolase
VSKTLHPRLSPQRRAQLARRAAVLFDGGRFFAAHEGWEEIWRSTDPEPRDLWQGLVQLAAAFHHLTVRGRADVALRVLGKARRRLANLPPAAAFHCASLGLDLAALLAAIDAWSSWLAADTPGAPPPPVRLVTARPA